MPSFKDQLSKARLAIAKGLIQHPWIMGTTVFASQLCFASAAEYFLREIDGNDSPCDSRMVPFAGFGALATRQCDPVYQVYQANQTSPSGLAYFELSSIQNWAGSDTLSQVVIECMQDKLSKIIMYILQSAQYSNPPINPFPNSYQGLCQITIDEWTVSSGSYDRKNHYHSSTIRPKRDVSLFFTNLNPSLCNNMIDYINSEATICHSQSRVSALDAGKAFLTIGLIIGAGLTLLGLILLVIFAYKCCSELSLPELSRMPTFNFGRDRFFASSAPRYAPTQNPATIVEIPSIEEVPTTETKFSNV